MLSLFPQILFLSPLTGTILRVVVALSLLYIAYVTWQRRAEIGDMLFPLIGRPGSAPVAISAVAKAIIGGALLIGYATQAFALLALLSFLKDLAFAKRYPRATPLCRLDYFYLMIMSLCVFLSGAGAFAFDLPL